jgi:TRAP-type C4-dicarboxylate transport system permease small subunit
VKRLAEVTERWLSIFTSVLLVAMVLVILAQVIFRYALNLSLAWTEEVGRYLFVWVCLFGASLAYRLGQHTGYETLVNLMPAPLARWVMIGVDVCVAVFSLMMVIASRDLIEAGLGQLTPATQFAIGYVYLAFPLSAVPTFIFVADALAGHRRPPSIAPVS